LKEHNRWLLFSTVFQTSFWIAINLEKFTTSYKKVYQNKILR